MAEEIAGKWKVEAGIIEEFTKKKKRHINSKPKTRSLPDTKTQESHST